MQNALKYISVLWALFMLMGCGTKTKDIPLVTLGSDKMMADSLTAEVKWTVFEGRKKRSVSGVISIVPNEKYKMDFMGIFHKHLGSFLWKKDSAWALLLTDENQVFTGVPEKVSLPIFGLENVPWKPFVDFLWNGLIYQEKFTVLKSDSLMDWYLSDKTKISYGVSKLNGDVLEVKKDDYKIYYDHQGSKEKSIPAKVRLFFRDKKQLEIHIKKIKWNPRWKTTPFTLKINGKTEIINI